MAPTAGLLMWNRIDEKATGGRWRTWEDNLSNLVCALRREHLVERNPSSTTRWKSTQEPRRPPNRDPPIPTRPHPSPSL